MRNAQNVLVGKPKRNGPLGRSRRRFEDNIKLETELEIVDWMHLAKIRTSNGLL
jgi:hypothetical protein